MSDASSWEREYVRRVTQALVPVHYEHGFRASAVNVHGDDGGAWSEVTWDSPTMDVSVRGDCPCGEQVYGYADTPEAIANLLQKITEERAGA